MEKSLSIHVSNIGYSLINQFTEKGVILTQDNSYVSEDIVSTHHTTEFLDYLNRNIFLHYIENTLKYFLNPENQVRSTLFSIDTLTRILPNTEAFEPLLNDILDSQLESGAFTKYTAFLHGGDFFSTLWCVKILMNADQNKYNEAISKGFHFLKLNILDKKISMNQKGFFFLLSNKFSFTEYDKTELKNQLIDYISKVHVTSNNLLWHLYIYEDLLSEDDVSTHSIVKKFFIKTFNLKAKAETLPIILEELKGTSHESVFYQCLARFCIVSLNFLEDNEILNISYEINKNIQSRGQEAVYIAIATDRKLKEYLTKYEGIHENFTKYNEVLSSIWKDQSPFDKSIFIMMPFNDDIGYIATSQIIKDACQKRGFKAIRVDDKDRKFHPTLWDNLVINMLSCKYAIAIYASEPVVDILDSNNPKTFPNPNVALEFGFFTSRGQKILLLRDEKSPVPSDLAGFLWYKFKIKKPGKDIENSVNDFIDSLIQEEKK